jgi:HPt (histidine-containing phosphotransfer) domain-containing protein
MVEIDAASMGKVPGLADKRVMTDSVINLAAALALVDGDRELLGELVGVFLQEYPAQLASVRDAVERRDPQGLRRTAHLLKGSLSAFGVNPAFNIAAHLEARGIDKDMVGAAADLPKLERASEALRDCLLQLG